MPQLTNSLQGDKHSVQHNFSPYYRRLGDYYISEREIFRKRKKRQKGKRCLSQDRIGVFCITVR